MSANSPWNTYTVLGIFHPRPILAVIDASNSYLVNFFSTVLCDAIIMRRDYYATRLLCDATIMRRKKPVLRAKSNAIYFNAHREEIVLYMFHSIAQCGGILRTV